MTERIFMSAQTPAREKERDQEEIEKIIDIAQCTIDNKTTPVLSETHESFFGICAKCSRFQFAESEFTVWHARCYAFERELKQREPITNCSNFFERGALDLYSMRSMAMLLDFNEKKVGFIKE